MNTVEALLIGHEDERLKPYRDTVGKLTVGVGRNLDDVGITQEESRYLLANDIKRVKQELQKNFQWTNSLDEVRTAVLIDMCFNLGLARFKGFKKFLAAMAVGNWQTAAVEMKDSAWWNQVGTRAVRLRAMVLTGLWPEK